MNLNEFERTDFSGLYISKEEHPEFGKKYIARFQYDKKRYVKVLGFSKKDKLTLKVASSLLEDFKNSVIKNVQEKSIVKIKDENITPKKDFKEN